jgi:membrane associated rhomboid family serine protease
MGVNFLEVKQLAGQLTFNQYKEVLEHGISILGTNEHYVNTTMNHLNSAINTGVVGASGAVFGVLLGFGMLFPNTELMLLLPPIPIKAKYLVLIYGAIEFFMAMGQYPKDNVAHYAHLGGMLFGFLLLKYWQKKGRAW